MTTNLPMDKVVNTPPPPLRNPINHDTNNDTSWISIMDDDKTLRLKLQEYESNNVIIKEENQLLRLQIDELNKVNTIQELKIKTFQSELDSMKNRIIDVYESQNKCLEAEASRLRKELNISGEIAGQSGGIFHCFTPWKK